MPSVHHFAPNVLPEPIVNSRSGFLQPGHSRMIVGPGVIACAVVAKAARASRHRAVREMLLIGTRFIKAHAG